MKEEEKQLFDAVFERADLLVIGVDKEGHIVLFNPACERVSGYSKEEALGKHFWDFAAAEDFDTNTLSLLEDFRDGKAITSFIYPLRTKGGYKRLISWDVAIIEDKNGRPDLALGLGLDISEKHRTEEMLAESEKQFRLLIENALDLVIVLKPEGTIHYIGPSVERLLGYKPEELLGRSIYELISPDQVSLGKEALQYASGREGITEHIEIQVRHKDGSWRLHEASSYNLLDNPAVGGIVINSRDITERKRAEIELERSEQQKKSILESVSELVNYQDRELRILWANQAACDSVGLTTEQFVGRHCYEIWGQRDDPCEGCPVVMAMESGRTEEAEITTPDARTWFIRAYPVKDDEGRVAGVVEITRDITERKKSELFTQSQRDLAIRLSEIIDLDEIYTISLETIIDASGMDCGGVYMVDEATGAIDMVHHQGISESYVRTVEHFDQGDPHTRIMYDGAPVFVTYEGLGLPGIEAELEEGLKYGAMVPIKFEKEVIGCINVASHTVTEIPREVRDQIEALAGQIGQAITRSRLQSALRESEERYRLFHDDAGLAVFTYDRDLKMISVNRETCEQIGYDEEELLGRNVLELGILHPDDFEKASRGIQVLFSGQRTHTEDLRLIRKDGSVMEVEMAGAAMRDKRGEIIAISSIVVDITERKRAERLVRIQRDLAIKLSGATDLNETFRISFEALLEATDMDSGGIYLSDGYTGAIDLVYHEGLSQSFAEAVSHYEKGTPNADLVYSGQSIYAEYSKLDIPRDDIHKNEGLKALAAVPLRFEGAIIGCVNIASHLVSEIPEPTRDVIEIMAGQISQAIARGLLQSALRESEERYRLLHDHAGEAIFTYNRDFTIMSVNRMACEKTGYSREELVGKNIFELGILHPDDLESSKKGARSLFEGGEGGRREIRLTRKDGSLLYMDITGTVLSDEEGRVVAVINIASDITERKLAEEEVARREEYFRALIENSSDVVTVLDSDGIIQFCSASAVKIIGYRPEELVGREPTIFFDRVHPDDFPKVIAAYEKDLSTPGITGFVEFRFRHKDGSWRVIEAIGNNLLDDPSVRGIVANWREITEQKRAEEAMRDSEQELRFIFESTGTAMCIIEPDSTISRINREFEKLSGYSRDEVEGKKKYQEFLYPEDLEMVERYARELFQGERQGPLNYEVRVVVGGGKVLNSLASVDFLPGTARAVLSIIDITDRKAVEEALRQGEERYHTTFESTGTAMFLVDKDATISDVNREMERMFGYSRDEVVDKMRYMKVVAPEDMKMVKDISLRLLKGEISGPVQYEIKAVRKNGELLDALVNVSTLPGIGKSVVSLLDITDKKSYEKELMDKAEQMRNFLDIAAHELRHPATLLKGYAITLDMYREKMDAENWDNALDAIGTGADRLVDVVEELLNISRIERDSYPMTRKEEEIGPLVDRAVEEILARGCESWITVEMGDGVGQASVDSEKLVRLLVILLDNAVKYSPTGSKIEITGKRKGEQLELSVIDRGIGVPAGDREKIFDRFYQVEDVIHHAGPGLGLGLYIGKRIVESHGGRIWCEPREGGGSIFRFTLPTQ
jgi:PAS domain S-box-containing protein